MWNSIDIHYFFIDFIKPSFFGCILTNGKKRNIEANYWKYEWVYDGNRNLVEDLNELLDELQNIMIQI